VFIDFTKITELKDPKKEYKITDLWTGSVLGYYSSNFSALNIPPHGNVALKLEPLVKNVTTSLPTY